MTGVAYFDSSALAKALLDESGSDELRTLATSHDVVTSELGVVETIRAAARQDVQVAWDDVPVAVRIPADELIMRNAARLEPAGLRSLDAIHLATALRIGTDLELFATYDERLGDAARAHGIRVVSPGS